MIISFIGRIFVSILSTFNQLIPKEKAKVKQTQLQRAKIWEEQKKKKKRLPHSAARHKQHDTKPLGAPHTDTKIFNHPRK